MPNVYNPTTGQMTSPREGMYLENLATITPVSYTHLDVYKRQGGSNICVLSNGR